MVKLDKTEKGNRIAFYGPMASGKSYMADYLFKNYYFHKISLADKLKAIAYELYGVQSKDGKGRQLYQELGDALRAFDNDCFTKYTLNRIAERYEKERVVIDDLRLPREAHLLRANGFVIIEVQTDVWVRDTRLDTLYPNVPRARQSHETEVSYTQIRRHHAVQSNVPSDVTELDSLLAEYWGLDNG